MTGLQAAVAAWYGTAARDLPWRRPDRTPWGVLVSEVMLQQTPVVRVEPVWRRWVQRWPTPGDLAAEPAGEAVRAWDRLGYPRRALRLHAAAGVIAERFAGRVPREVADLRSLPGVGEYTAAAVATFAYGDRHVVLDTNVRRVLARVVAGQAQPAPVLSPAERREAALLLPADRTAAARWAVAVMELGALVCTSLAPRCGRCPVADRCAWRAAGYPPYAGPVRAAQPWAGTDRQLRGELLAVLRASDGPVPAGALEAVRPGEPAQLDRCVRSLLADGLVEALPDGRYALPG